MEEYKPLVYFLIVGLVSYIFRMSGRVEARIAGFIQLVCLFLLLYVAIKMKQLGANGFYHIGIALIILFFKRND